MGKEEESTEEYQDVSFGEFMSWLITLVLSPKSTAAGIMSQIMEVRRVPSQTNWSTMVCFLSVIVSNLFRIKESLLEMLGETGEACCIP